MTRGLWLLAAVAVFAHAGEAHAGPARDDSIEEARRRFARGTRAYESGDYADALLLYKAAYQLHPTLGSLYNIGLASEKVGDYEGCVRALRKVARETQDEEVREGARTRSEQCNERVRLEVSVSSLPAGAAVYVTDGDERSLQGRTPLLVEVRPGRHQLAIELPGYVAAGRAIDVDIDAVPAVDVTLTQLATMSIESDTAGARARIDDGEWRDLPLTEAVAPAEHTVTVRREGHETVVRELSLSPGQTASLVVSLPKLPIVNTLSIDVTGNAAVFIDGEKVGRGAMRRDLEAGFHRVEVVSPGHIPFAEDIRLPEESDLELDVRLASKRTPTQRKILWGMAIGSGAAAVGGAVFTGMAASDHAQFQDDPTPMLKARGERNADAADALFGVSVGLAATAVVYYYLTRPDKSRATKRHRALAERETR